MYLLRGGARRFEASVGESNACELDGMVQGLFGQREY
jgi:hypothetical protein